MVFVSGSHCAHFDALTIFVFMLSFLNQTLKPSAQLLPQLSKVLKLNRVQEVVYAFALVHSSNPDIVQYATQFLKQKIPDLIHSYVDAGMQA